MVELSKAHQPEVLVAHANARLTPAGRAILCQRIASGRPVAHVAAEMGISRTCAYRWWARYRHHGPAGLQDRPSPARSHPWRVPTEVEAHICWLRRTRKLGPARIGPLSTGLPPPFTESWSVTTSTTWSSSTARPGP